jgi:hypothetical protein
MHRSTDFTPGALILPICVFISILPKSVGTFRPVVFLHTTTITEATVSGHAVQGPKRYMLTERNA